MSYQRVKISGVIECQADMCIASGQVKENDKKQTYTDICLDFDDKPYIPASSLRGLLRDLPDFKNLEGLFDTNDGVLRFYDATWQPNQKIEYKEKTLHTRNKINQRTGTAEDKHLYSHAIVPAGSCFECEIEADNINEEQLKDLLGLLNCLDANPLSQLGKHQSKQQGLIKWQTDKADIKVLEDVKLIDWLVNDNALEFSNITHQITASVPNFKNNLSCFECTFIPHSPILINDPNLVTGISEQPDLEFYRNAEDKLIIPSSSLIGVMRGQCRKILLTLLMANSNAGLKAAEDKADKFLGELFGCTGQRSRVWLTDAIATNTESHLQMFTAIDRFTGGVKDGALYSANAAIATTIAAKLYFDQSQKPFTKAEKGLLVLLLRDAMEGDLKVGWGKSKGYGILQLTNIKKDDKSLGNWSELLAQKQKLETYLTALRTELGG